jgi:hypothetical protein
VMPGAVFSGAATFTGALYTTRGPYFGGPFIASHVDIIPFGDATVDFSGAGATSAAPKIWNPKSGKTKIRTRDGQVINKTLKQQRYGYDAPATPPAQCSPTYGAWSACSADGFQSRLRIATNPPGCASEPYEFRPCTNAAACVYTYSAWSECQNGMRTRQVLSALPAGCTGTPDALTEACSAPPPSCTYTLGPWSACVNGVRTRTVTAVPNGCTPNNPPPASEACGVTPPPQAGTCIGNGTITVTGQLRDPSRGFCVGSLPITSSTSIRIEMEPWNQAGSHQAVIDMDHGHWLCANDRATPGTQRFAPIVALSGAGSSFSGQGSSTDSAGTFTINFTLNGRTASGNVSRTYRQSNDPSVNWSWTGNFSCTL